MLNPTEGRLIESLNPAQGWSVEFFIRGYLMNKFDEKEYQTVNLIALLNVVRFQLVGYVGE